mmetsp:Transcript_87878/g.272142  ORF Transcript_87878/g.272142 Transcript_87878/m.272142 type:complete len:314 (-) Transcript_87878:73-1014(-)
MEPPPTRAMGGRSTCRAAGCLVAGLLLCASSARLTAFVAAQLKVPAPSAHLSSSGGSLPQGVELRMGSASSATGGGVALLGLCGAALVAAVARGRRVAMQGQGQSGRFNVGQYFMPKLKGAKKMAVLRKRKNYGSHGARKVPRRYPLYDILEEIDEKVPWYTVISEPEEPMLPVPDAPLLKRYPWAGPLGGVPEEKQEVENDRETALEPFFGSWTECPPPLGRRQNYVFRRGWPRYNFPPWINRPLIGEGVKVPGDLAWSKDRRPKPENMTKTQLKKYEAAQAAKEAEITDEVIDELEDMDDALDAMEKAAED